MSRIFWDTNLFIYLFEDSGERASRVVSLRQRMLERNDQLYTSTLTLGEVLVKPVERGDESLRERYETALSQAVTLIPFDREAGRSTRGSGRTGASGRPMPCSSPAPPRSVPISSSRTTNGSAAAWSPASSSSRRWSTRRSGARALRIRRARRSGLRLAVRTARAASAPPPAG